MIGQTTFRSIGTQVNEKSKSVAKVFTNKERRANIGLALNHYFRKDAGRNTALGALTSSEMSRTVITAVGRRPDTSSTVFALGNGAVIANILGVGYRTVRTFFRNPASEQTVAQMARYQRDLDEAGPSLTSRVKEQAAKLKNRLSKRV